MGMASLQPGGNVVLGFSSGSVIVSHAADHELDVNLTAFMLDDNGKVQDDSGIVFYNQAVHPSGAAHFMPVQDGKNSTHHKIDFDVRKLPAGISKIAITLTVNHARGFAAVRNLSATIEAGSATCDLVPGMFTDEKGIIVLELYVRDEQTKARAVWQGFASGLDGLCEYYGVDVEDKTTSTATSLPAALPCAPVCAVPAAPPAAQKASKITLTKSTESHTVSLIKNATAPDKILISVIWTDNGDNRDDNDDLDLRVGILLPDGKMKIIHAPHQRGAFDHDPYVFHTGDATKASVKVPGKETIEVNPAISSLMGGRVALVCSVYSAIKNGVVSVASLKPKMRMEYGNQVVECAFEFKKKFGSSFIYTYVIGIIEVDQDRITLKPSGETSGIMSEATPWLEWHQGTARLTMDGPVVFKGKPVRSAGSKNYC